MLFRTAATLGTTATIESYFIDTFGETDGIVRALQDLGASPPPTELAVPPLSVGTLALASLARTIRFTLCFGIMKMITHASHFSKAV